MPRIGEKHAMESLGIVLGVCLAFAGCTTGRDFVGSDGNLSPGSAFRGAIQSSDTKQGMDAAPRWAGGIVEGPTGLTIPRELAKASHPAYVIEPPDILVIDAVRLIPRPPYRVEPLDSLAIAVTNTLPNAPIEAIYAVDPGGMVDLGFTYGVVQLNGKTLPEVKETIEEHLKKKLKPPYEVYVSLAQSRVMQQVRGEHLVRLDGTVGLGTYGGVYVTGMTIQQAKEAIEKHLSQFLFDPKVSVDVSGFNSHVFFVIFDFPGTGQQVYRLPITGNETVLDALSDTRGLPAGLSKRRIWVARPGPAEAGHSQILPVDWAAITRDAAAATNYQLLPGDRIYVAQDPLAALDITLSRIFAPMERTLGIVLFGNSVIQNLRGGSTGGVGTR